MKVVKSQKKETHFAIFLFIYKNFQRKNYFAVEATCFFISFSITTNISTTTTKERKMFNRRLYILLNYLIPLGEIALMILMLFELHTRSALFIGNIFFKNYYNLYYFYHYQYYHCD